MRRLNDAAGRALCPDNCAVCSGREPRSAEHVVGFFEEFVPFPAEHGWDYGWCNLHWGVKWDARDIDGEDGQYHFNTPWGPPIEFYDAMTDLGFKVKAFYEELGDRLVGVCMSMAKTIATVLNFVRIMMRSRGRCKSTLATL